MVEHALELQAIALLQVTATHCNTPQHTATHCNTLQYTATWGSEGGARNRAAGNCSVAGDCIALQHTAIRCNTLQHDAIALLQVS